MNIIKTYSDMNNIPIFFTHEKVEVFCHTREINCSSPHLKAMNTLSINTHRTER